MRNLMVIFFLGVMFIGCEKSNNLNDFNITNGEGVLSASIVDVPCTFSIVGNTNKTIFVNYNGKTDTLYGVHNQQNNTIDITPCENCLVDDQYGIQSGEVTYNNNNKINIFTTAYFGIAPTIIYVTYTVLED